MSQGDASESKGDTSSTNNKGENVCSEELCVLQRGSVLGRQRQPHQGRVNVTILLMLLFVHSTSSTLGGISQQKSQSDNTSQSDFYYSDGKRIFLEPSQNECVVHLKTKPDATLEALVNGLSVKVVAAELRSEGRIFEVLTVVASARGPGQAEQLMSELRLNDQVEFVAPVFYERQTRVRMIPTDEIVVKMKPMDTERDLEEISHRRGLVIVKAMPGTRDQYMLRVESKFGDVLREARLLYESGRFQWVEPSFIREFREVR